jgi:hypothetical protein
MPQPTPPEEAGLALDLQSFRVLCEEVLDLVTRESQALVDQNYQPGEFDQPRKSLLPKLESALVKLGDRRKCRRPAVQPEEIKTLFQAIENLLIKTLQLDHENQQALLRRGLVPARHLPAVAVQPPHCVVDLYRRYSLIRGAGPVLKAG